MAMPRMLASSAAKAIAAPLGRPVVPEVNMTRASSGGAVRAWVAAPTGRRRASTPSGSGSTIVAQPASLALRVTSASGSRRPSETTLPPARHAACRATTDARSLPRRMPVRVPGCSRLLSAALAAASSPNVAEVPAEVPAGVLTASDRGCCAAVLASSSRSGARQDGGVLTGAVSGQREHLDPCPIETVVLDRMLAPVAAGESTCGRYEPSSQCRRLGPSAGDA